MHISSDRILLSLAIISGIKYFESGNVHRNYTAVLRKVYVHATKSKGIMGTGGLRRLD